MVADKNDHHPLCHLGSINYLPFTYKRVICYEDFKIPKYQGECPYGACVKYKFNLGNGL